MTAHSIMHEDLLHFHGRGDARTSYRGIAPSFLPRSYFLGCFPDHKRLQQIHIYIYMKKNPKPPGRLNLPGPPTCDAVAIHTSFLLRSSKPPGLRLPEAEQVVINLTKMLLVCEYWKNKKQIPRLLVALTPKIPKIKSRHLRS